MKEISEYSLGLSLSLCTLFWICGRNDIGTKPKKKNTVNGIECICVSLGSSQKHKAQKHRLLNQLTNYVWLSGMAKSECWFCCFALLYLFTLVLSKPQTSTRNTNINIYLKSSKRTHNSHKSRRKLRSLHVHFRRANIRILHNNNGWFYVSHWQGVGIRMKIDGKRPIKIHVQFIWFGHFMWQARARTHRTSHTLWRRMVFLFWFLRFLFWKHSQTIAPLLSNHMYRLRTETLPLRLNASAIGKLYSTGRSAVFASIVFLQFYFFKWAFY